MAVQIPILYKSPHRIIAFLRSTIAIIIVQSSIPDWWCTVLARTLRRKVIMAREIPTIPVMETALDLSRRGLPQTVSVMFLITGYVSLLIYTTGEDKPKASVIEQLWLIHSSKLLVSSISAQRLVKLDVVIGSMTDSPMHFTCLPQYMRIGLFKVDKPHSPVFLSR